MDSAEFVARLAEAQSSEQLEALRSAAIAEENRFRELFAQARDDWEVPGELRWDCCCCCDGWEIACLIVFV
jgi:hypothetical protein